MGSELDQYWPSVGIQWLDETARVWGLFVFFAIFVDMEARQSVIADQPLKYTVHGT